MPLSLIHGFLIGLSQFAATLAVFALGMHSSSQRVADAQRVENILGYILLMVLLGLAHRAAKRASLARGEPEFRLGAAAKFSAATAAVGGISAGAFQWLYAALINPRVCELQRDRFLEQAGPELAKLSPDDLARATQQIELATSAGARSLIIGVNTFLFALVLGLAYALIFRAAVRRDAAASRKTS